MWDVDWPAPPFNTLLTLERESPWCFVNTSGTENRGMESEMVVAAPLPTLNFTVNDNRNPITGPVPNGGDSNDPAPTIDITAAAYASAGADVGDWLNIIENGVIVKSVHLTSADLNGTSTKVPHVADGTYNFSVSITSAKGGGTLEAGSATSTDIVDTAKPVISNILVGSSPDTSHETLSGGQAVAGFTVTGSVTDGGNDTAGQTIVVNLKDGNNVIDTVHGIVQPNGTWSVTFSGDFSLLTHSNDSITAFLTDKAGNTSPTASQGFTYTACFMAGTMVRGPNGEVAVETLKIGDPVVTHDGRVAPVRWVGRQTVSLIFADPLRVLPIRIKAGALADNVPARDLLLSPDHALLVDGVLMQAGALVNGTSIVRESNVPQTFTYYHVELDDHALILAENTPAETFIDNVDRLAFDNWAEHEALYAGTAPLAEMSYPRAKAHRQVPQATRRRLAARASELIGNAAIVAA
jgi:hypothetical protein